MQMEFQDPIKGSSSAAPSAIPSAPQQDYYGAGNNFNYQQQPPPQPTMGIPVNVMHNSSHHQPPLSAPVPWSTGLCDCSEDRCNCCQTFWCPCITFGQIAEITDKGATSCGVSGSLYALMLFVTGCTFCYSCFYRSKLRAEYSLEESTCPDCCVHFWCEYCALCQEYRELKNRGFDMAIGWHGNMERQARGQSAASPMVQQPIPPMVQQPMRR